MGLSGVFSSGITAANFISALIVVTILIVALISSICLVIGIYQYFKWRNDINKKKNARKRITHSIIGLVMAFIVWFVINIISAFFGIHIGAEPKYIVFWKCPPKAIKIIVQKNLRPVHSCAVNETAVDGQPGDLVHIKYGPAVSCGSFECVYKEFTAVSVNNNLFEVQPEPDLNQILAYNFGNGCQIDQYKEINGLRKTFKTVDGKLHWNFEFTNYGNQNFMLQNMIRDRNLASLENPQICILNGDLPIQFQTAFDAITADFTNLKAEMKTLVSVTPYPLEQIINYCNQSGVDQCYFYLAVGRSDFKYCNLIKTVREKDRCLDVVARDSKQVTTCELIQDNLLKSQCARSIEKQ